MSELRGWDPPDWISRGTHGAPDHVIQKTIELERIQFFQEQVASRWCVERMDPQDLETMIRRDVVYRATLELLGKKSITRLEKTITYPADWWNAFKERFAPRWWLSRWPVRLSTETVVLEVEAIKLFPELWPFERGRRTITFVSRESVEVKAHD